MTTHDPIVRRRWAGILPLLDAHGLVARFCPAEDMDVDDAIEIRRADAGEDEDLGDIQLCGRDEFCGNSWTSTAHEARRHGMPRRSCVTACEDLLRFLRQDGLI